MFYVGTNSIFVSYRGLPPATQVAPLVHSSSAFNLAASQHRTAVSPTDQTSTVSWEQEVLPGQLVTVTSGDIFSLSGYFYCFEVGLSTALPAPAVAPPAVFAVPQPSVPSFPEVSVPKPKPVELAKVETQIAPVVDQPKPTALNSNSGEGHSQTKVNLSSESADGKLEAEDSEVLITFSSAPSTSFARLLAESNNSTASSTGSIAEAAAKTADLAPQGVLKAMKDSAGSTNSDQSHLSTSSEATNKGNTIVLLASSSGSHESVEVDILSDSRKESPKEQTKQTKKTKVKEKKATKRQSATEESSEEEGEAAEDAGGGNRRKSSRKRKALFHLSQLDLEPTRLTQEFDLDGAVEATKPKAKKRKLNSEEGKKNGDDAMDIDESAGLKKKSKPKKPSALVAILREFLPESFSAQQKTALVTHEDCLRHLTPSWHNEKPERLSAILDVINLIQSHFGEFILLDKNNIQPIAEEWLLLCHDKVYLERMQGKIPEEDDGVPLHATLTITQDLQLDSDSIPRDTYVSHGSWNAALLSAGAVCKAIDYVCGASRQSRNAFCAVRPPGHHAGPSGHARAASQGYCLINNVAIGAMYATRTYNVERICILDFDVHAGNGTSQILERHPHILFISMHCDDIYPFDEEHPPNQAPHLPHILNVGYRERTTRRTFLKLFDEKVKPAIEAFKPQLFLLSAGFDAHVDDPTAACSLTHEDYAYMTEQVKLLAHQFANDRIVSVLEGGYNVQALQQCVMAHVCELMRM